MELQVLQRVIAHIEEHLWEDKPYLLDNAALAKVAGLSVFHFLREFRAAAGLSAADYIRKRRISEIVKRMGEERPMSDIAFEYGFNSKEHFTRAFKKEHGVLPSAYKKAGCSLRLYEPLRLSPACVPPKVSLGYRINFHRFSRADNRCSRCGHFFKSLKRLFGSALLNNADSCVENNNQQNYNRPPASWWCWVWSRLPVSSSCPHRHTLPPCWSTVWRPWLWVTSSICTVSPAWSFLQFAALSQLWSAPRTIRSWQTT